jgi:hypothetical protein
MWRFPVCTVGSTDSTVTSAVSEPWNLQTGVGHPNHFTIIVIIVIIMIIMMI